MAKAKPKFSMEVFKECFSVRVEKGSRAVWPNGKTTVFIGTYVDVICDKFEGCYSTAINPDGKLIVAYIVDHELWVMPADFGLKYELLKHGFKAAKFTVPFSRGEVPESRQDYRDFMLCLEAVKKTA